MGRRTPIFLCVAGAWLAVGTSSAAIAPDARVVVRPQVGMADIKLGDSARSVRAKLGVPTRVSRITGGFAPYTKWRYRKLGLTVGMIGYRGRVPFVLVLETDSAGAKTPRGVGVGSTYAELLSVFPEATCNRFRGRLSCYIGEPGFRITSFAFLHRAVVSISMGDTL